MAEELTDEQRKAIRIKVEAETFEGNVKHYRKFLFHIEKKDIEGWNKWKKENFSSTINLDGANFRHANMEGGVDLSNASLRRADFNHANLKKAKLYGAQLDESNLSDTNLEGANLHGANLGRADLWGAHLMGADLIETQLEEAVLGCARMEGANLTRAQLEGANLDGTHLEGANLTRSNLERANLNETHLEGANLTHAKLEGAELIDIYIGEYTDLKGNEAITNFQNTFFGNSILSLNKNCKANKNKQSKMFSLGIVNTVQFINPVFGRQVRDEAWLHHYKSNRKGWWQRTKRWFWEKSSDYGRSIGRWAFCSLVIAAIFGIIFCALGPEYFKDKPEGYTWFSFFYYSIVTFTTLGFGDITPIHLFSEILVTVEVILGYMMLGGLVSILANNMARRND